MNHNYFPGIYPLWQIWLDGSIGHFGWLNYTFPLWVYHDFQTLVYALAALGAIGLWRVRAAIRPLLGLFACYAVMALGLLAIIGYLGARDLATSTACSRRRATCSRCSRSTRWRSCSPPRRCRGAGRPCSADCWWCSRWPTTCSRRHSRSRATTASG